MMELPQPLDEGNGDLVQLELSLNIPCDTKSSIEVDQNKITNVIFYAFTDGQMACTTKIDKGNAGNVLIDKNRTYNFYAIANQTSKNEIIDEQMFLESASITIGKITDLNNKGIPMVWSRSGFKANRDGNVVKIVLERLTAAINLTIDKKSLPDFSVNSVKLCQAARKVELFHESFAKHPEDVIDGDFASTTDLANLNSGKPVRFYALENMQGTLLPYNNDPWEKKPENIPDREALCTYIEVQGNFAANSSIQGMVTYRFYLGRDNCSDFNLERNTINNITLCLSENIINKLTWKIESSVTVDDESVTGTVIFGYHQTNDLYTGEIFTYAITAHPKFTQNFNENIADCNIQFIGNDGIQHITFSKALVDSNPNTTCFNGRCHSKGEGSIWLCNNRGEKLTQISSNVIINDPNICISSSMYRDNSHVTQMNSLTQILNSNTETYIYLIDKNGNNLNISKLFDPSLFTISHSKNIYNNSLTKFFNIKVNSNSNQVGPIAIMQSNFKNDGLNYDINESICRVMNTGNFGDFTLSDNHNTRTKSIPIHLGITPIEITLMDNQSSHYYNDCQMSIAVNNPSNIPSDIDIWQVIYANEQTAAVAPPLNLQLDEYHYLNDVYANINDLRACFGTGCKIHCSKDGRGDEYTLDGNLMIYPVRNIATTDILSAIMSAGYKEESFSNNIDVNLSKKIPGIVAKYINKISNNSSSCHYEGLCGFSQGQPLNPNRYRPKCCLLSPSGLTGITTDPARNQTFSLDYNSVTDKLLLKRFLYGPNDSIIDVMIRGTVNGYVLTHPKGTNHKGLENFCSTRITQQVNNYQITDEGIPFGDQVFVKPLGQIYSNTFADSYNKIGSSNSYWHHAHAKNVELDIQIKQSVPTPMYDTDIINDILLYHEHEQDNKTYSVPVKLKCHLHKFVNVTRKK